MNRTSEEKKLSYQIWPEFNLNVLLRKRERRTFIDVKTTQGAHFVL